MRESARSRRERLVDVKRRGLSVAPTLAVGDGALGFWKALDEVFPGARHQRCWQHETANVLDKVPKSVQSATKADLREIADASTRARAEVAMDVLVEKYGVKYARASECLTTDKEALLAFYDMPAEHWDHLRTTNPIEEGVSATGAAGGTGRAAGEGVGKGRESAAVSVGQDDRRRRK